MKRRIKDLKNAMRKDEEELMRREKKKKRTDGRSLNRRIRRIDIQDY